MIYSIFSHTMGCTLTLIIFFFFFLTLGEVNYFWSFVILLSYLKKFFLSKLIKIDTSGFFTFFYTLTLTFGSLIHFESFFLHMVRVKIDSGMSLTAFGNFSWKYYPLPTELSWHSVESVDHKCMVHVWIFSYIPISICVSLCHDHTVLIIVVFLVSFTTGNFEYSNKHRK